MKKHPVFALLLVVFLDLLGLGIIIPIIAPLFLQGDYSLFAHDVSFSVRTITMGFLVAAYPLAQFFGAPVLGGFSDRIGRKKALIISIMGTCIGYLLFGLAIIIHSIPLLFISRILDGFTGGNISVAMSALADVSTKEDKARNFGYIGLAFGLGFIFGPFIGGKLADPEILSWFNLSTPLWFAAVLSGLNLLLLQFQFKETLVQTNHTPIDIYTGFRNIARALRIVNLRVLFIMIFLLVLGFNFFTQFFQVFLVEKFNYTQSQIGNLFAYIGLWVAITQGVLTKPISRRFKPEQILSVAPFLLALTMPFLLFPDRHHVLYFILPLVALFQGLTQPNTTALISNLSSIDTQGEILGISQSFQSLAQAIPPIIAGFIISLHLNLPIIVSSIVLCLGWLIFLFGFKSQHRTHFHESPSPQ